jgi:hypothetical protein
MTADPTDHVAPEHWGDGLPCPKCRRVNLPEHSWFVSYFDSNEVRCIGCQEPFDLWTQALNDLSDMPAPWVAFRLIGAVQSHWKVPIPPEKTSPLDLSIIPPTAEILHVGITGYLKGGDAQASTFPGLVLMNDLQFDPFPRHLVLYGLSHGRTNVSTSEAWVTVTWIDPDPDDVSTYHLTDAAKQFAAGRYNRMLMSANIAVEAALTPALLIWVRRYCRKEDAEDFLGPRGATYAHQLKVLTQISGKTLGIGMMAGTLSNLLDDLRRYRNDLVHKGALLHKDRPPPSREQAAKFLSAATFGYHYARYLKDRVEAEGPQS